jgi:hypothetical protein
MDVRWLAMVVCKPPVLKAQGVGMAWSRPLPPHTVDLSSDRQAELVQGVTERGHGETLTDLANTGADDAMRK